MPKLAAVRSVFVALVAAAVLAGAPFASAASQQQTPGAAAIQQYVESLPTGSGQAVAGVTAAERAKLPAAAVESLRYAPAATARMLAEVATSPEYGAPTARASGTDVEPSSPSVGEAVWRSLGNASETRLLVVVGLLVVLTVAAGALAARGTRL